MARKKSTLSTLELTFLGMAWLRGPCTTYAIMKELGSSASTYHKSRAGATYAVAKRLLGFGLIASVDDQVRITPAGIEALQKWLQPPLDRHDIAHSADLVRLRFFFLGVIDPEHRLKFIDDAIRGLEEFLVRCEGLVPKNEEIGDYFGALATVSSILETRSRIEWLRLVREWVVNPIPEGQSWSEIIARTLREPTPPKPARK